MFMRIRTASTIRVMALLSVGWLTGCRRSAEREFAAGVRALNRGRYVEARARFEKAVFRRPGAEDNAQVYEHLGHACWRLSEVEASAAAFQESRRLDPNNWRVIYNLGVIYAAAGDAVRAAALFEEAALVAPHETLPREYLAHLHALAGRWKEARQVLTEALALAPRSVRLLTCLAVCELHLEGPEKAVSRLASVLEMDPEYPPALFNLFAIHAYRFGRRAEAVAHGRRFLAVASAYPRVAEVVRTYIAEQPLNARAAATAATGVSPTIATTRTEDWRAQAQRLVERGQAAAAVQTCLAAAEAARASGNADERERALKTATEIAFDVADGHAALGRYWLEKGRFESAVSSLKQAVVLGDDSEETHLALAEAAERVGEYDAALVALRRAAQRPRAGAQVQWRLAMFYDQILKSPPDALREYRAFVSRFTGDSRVLRARERIQALTSAVAAPEVLPPREEPRAKVELRSTTEPRVGETPPQPMLALPAVPEVAPVPAESRRIQWRPPVVRNPQAAAQAYNRAADYYRRGDRERAIFFFTRAIENDDTLADAFLGLGAIYLETGDAELAKDAYRLALERRPDDPAAAYNLALAHHALKENEAAIQQAERALRMRPDHAPMHYLMGTLLADVPGRRAEARAHFERFLALAPNDPNAETVRRWLAHTR